MAIALLLCLTIQIGTTLLWFTQQQYEIKKAVKHQIIAGIENSDLELIKIADADKDLLLWEHAKEFEYAGFMYDVVEFSKFQDTTFYYCWKDYAETELEKELKAKVAQLFNQHPDKNQKNNQLLDYLKNLSSSWFSSSIPLPLTYIIKRNEIEYKRSHTPIALTIPSPPPQV